MAGSAGDKSLMVLLLEVSRVSHRHTNTRTLTTLYARGCTLPTAYKGPQVNTMK